MTGADEAAPVEPKPTTRGRGKWIVATVGLILVVGAAEVPILRGNGSKQPAVARATGSDWLIPGTIDGYHLTFARLLQTGVVYPERYRMQLARPTPGGGFTDPVTVMIGDSVHLLIPDDGTSLQRRTTIDVNGRSAEIIEVSNSGATVLQYQLDDGDAVVFVDNVDPVSGETRQLLQRFAGVIKPADVGGLTVRGDLPAGFKVLAVMNMQRAFGAAPQLRFVDNDTTQSLLTIDAEASPPKGYELFRITSEVEPVKVRGVTGWITTGADSTIGGKRSTGSTTIFWREPHGQVVSINSTGPIDGAPVLSKVDLVAIANGLQLVSEADWQKFAHTADSTGEGVGTATVPITTP